MAATLSSVVWLLVPAVVIGAVLVVVAMRRRSATAVPSAPVVAAATGPADEPMVGLESALSRVTDRSGRPIREHIDAEQQHVDDLRVPDDTGPLLRRALDHVAPPGPARDESVNTATDTA